MDTRRSVIGRPNLSISGIQAPLQIHVSIPLRLFDAHRETIVAVGSVVMKTKTPNSAFGIGRRVQRRIAPRTLSFPKREERAFPLEPSARCNRASPSSHRF